MLRRRAALAVALGLAAGLGWGGGARAEGESLELAVKATYLYKLAPFVSWPSGAWPSPNAPLVICVQGADPFGSLLDRAAAGQAVGAHLVMVRRLARLDADSGCHIAFIAGDAGQAVGQALQAVSGTPVLTVTDESRPAAPRGIVNLVLDGGKVRFTVDALQADKSGVAISSKLLALALAVKR